MNHQTDRELLELAARASGFGGPEHKFCWTENEYPRCSGTHGALWNYVGFMDSAVLWNPLTDDGDALRLAVKLCFIVDTHGTHTRISFPFGDSMCHEAHGDDPYAATRRAIVLAAATINKAGA